MASAEIILFHNCKILTIDEENTIAETMAIEGEHIIAVGTMSRVRAGIKSYLAQKNIDGNFKPRIVERDLAGKCLLPGFIDSHLHPGLYIYFKTQLDLARVRSYAALNEAIKLDDMQREKEEWILGSDIMEDLFDDPGERYFPTRVDLDRACSARPVVVIRHDGHICAANSVALEALHVTKETVKSMTPPGGEIRVDARGEPTGVFTETATSIPLERVPMPTMDRLERAGKAFSKELAAHGITSFGGVVQFGTDGIAGQAGAIEVPLMELLIKHKAIDQDVVFYVVTGKPKQLARADKAIRKAAEDSGRFVVGGIKLYADGSFGARTAAMYEPYSDSASGERGFMVKDHASLLGIFKETHELGRQIIIHAIGDKANREVVDVFKEILKGTKNVHHHRIEHASTLTPDTLADIAELGIILACQPAFINSEVTWLEKRVGPDRLKRTYAFKSMLDSGIVLAGASDAPIESVHVFKAVQACVTRRGLVPSERISVLDALRVFTMNSAIAINQEKVKGSLEPGKLADFIIIDKDPLRVPQDELETILVKETYHRGLRIFP